MRIAFVNQPFDTITPPFQNSIGYATYGMGLALSASCGVTAYGLREAHPADAEDNCDGRLHLRLISARSGDQRLFQARKKLGNLVPVSSPISTWGRLFADYGRRVAEDLRNRRCDIIHLQHCSQYAGIIRALNPGARIVLQLHAEWFSQSNFKELAARLAHVDRVVTVSDYITRKTQAAFPAIAGRCDTVPCGIDPQEFRLEKNYEAVRESGTKQLLFAGAVSPHKGPHILLEAFETIEKQCPEARLKFVGTMRNYPLEETFDLAQRDTLRAVAPFYRKRPFTRLQARLGWKPKDAGTYQADLKKRMSASIAAKVEFAGFVSREEFVRSYYESDVFVFPPIWEEGFGIPPVEAMAAGTPVVGSRSGALGETVREGETGFLVEKNDARGLAEAALRLLGDDKLRERMGRAARRHALGTYAWEHAANRLLRSYREALNGSQSGAAQPPCAPAGACA